MCTPVMLTECCVCVCVSVSVCLCLCVCDCLSVPVSVEFPPSLPLSRAAIGVTTSNQLTAWCGLLIAPTGLCLSLSCVCVSNFSCQTVELHMLISRLLNSYLSLPLPLLFVSEQHSPVTPPPSRYVFAFYSCPETSRRPCRY